VTDSRVTDSKTHGRYTHMFLLSPHFELLLRGNLAGPVSLHLHHRLVLLLLLPLLLHQLSHVAIRGRRRREEWVAVRGVRV